MEVTINTVSDCDREMLVNMTQDELQPHFEKAYREAAPNLEIKGFRKGKVPMHIIKKMFGASIEYQTIEEITNDTFRKEIETRNINPIGTPTIINIDFKPGTPLSFKVKYEVKPDFELKDYRSIAVEKYVHKANETEIQSEIERLQQINAANEDAPKVDGDNFAVTVDMIDYDEQGKLLASSKRNGMRISLKEKQTEQEIKDALQGVAVGDVKEVQFEHQHGDHTHKVHLQITVKKIEKVILPSADDALAKKVSNDKFQTIEELKQNITKDLNEFWADRSERRFESDLLNEIVKQYDFAVPESLVQSVIDTYIDDAKSQQPNRQLPKGFDEKKYRDSARGTAVWQAKWLLIKEQFITKEKIEISDAEIEKIAEEESTKLNIDKARLLNFYKTSENALERLKYNRLIDILKQNIKIKEVETDDYSKFAVN
ncbi:MAG: trigger factor [Ignavibacteriales bacterium]|nr:trigger factor [Ignavibacteriales bacterium]